MKREIMAQPEMKMVEILAKKKRLPNCNINGEESSQCEEEKKNVALGVIQESQSHSN
jgi:hypothetical protein